MREEEEPNWFARWEEQLPSPDELMPLSQTLISPDLALAFDICTPTSVIAAAGNHLSSSPLTPPSGSFLRAGGGGGCGHPQSSSIPAASASDFEPSDLNSASAAAGGGSGSGGDEPARTLKRPRLVWTPQLHKRFVDAVAHLGIKNAVPKTIMQLMSVDGLTRENVASHLQKYRLYLKRMQGLGGAGGGAAAAASVDAATDQLFANGPVPHHFLSQGPVSGPGGSPEPFLPFGPVAAALQHQQQHMTAASQQQHHHQQQFYHQRHLGRHFDLPTGSVGGVGTFDHGFLSMGMQQPLHQIMRTTPGIGLVQPPLPPPAAASYVDAGERTVLTLFPSGEH